MKINVYYGGRGLLDDPTLYVLNKMEDVLKELRVQVVRYNIYEHKNEIATLPQTFKDADGIILATTSISSSTIIFSLMCPITSSAITNTGVLNCSAKLNALIVKSKNS